MIHNLNAEGITRFRNFIANEWVIPDATATAAAINRGTLDQAVHAASRAFRELAAVPVGDRVQHLFSLTTMLEAHLEARGLMITIEWDAPFTESRGELRRAIELALHGHGGDTAQFFTQEKAPHERWPTEWSRKF